jgi:hypothetical protein
VGPRVGLGDAEAGEELRESLERIGRFTTADKIRILRRTREVLGLPLELPASSKLDSLVDH